MRTKKSLIILLSIFIIVLMSLVSFISACSAPTTTPTSSSPAKTLKIGAVMSTTGWYSVIDALESAEVQAVMELINDQGGITVNGQKYLIEVVVEDAKSTFDGVATAATKLVYDHGVKFVVGPTAFFSTASSPIFEQNGILHVSGYITGAPGELGPDTPYGFLGHNCAIADAAATVKAMKKEFPNVKRVAIALPDEGTLSFVMPKHLQAIEREGYTVVGDIVGYPNELEDFSSITAKLNSIKDADGYLLLNGAPPHLGNILKGLRELGNEKPCGTSSLVSCDIIASLAGPAGSTGAISMAITPNAPGNSAELNKIIDSLGSQYEEQRVIYMMTGNALWVLTQMIEAAQSLDPTDVKNKWDSMNEVETPFGKGIICGSETYGIKHAIAHPMPYQKLMNGTVSPGGWVDISPLP